jgi:hypothetical protein
MLPRGEVGLPLDESRRCREPEDRTVATDPGEREASDRRGEFI